MRHPQTSDASSAQARPLKALRAARALTRRRAGLLAGAALALSLPLSAAWAQQASAWPSKPVKIVVNFPPGGAADQIARAIGTPLQEALGQPVVIENRGGAGGNVGGDVVAKSAPDGYTFLMSSGGMVSVNPFIYEKMPFDPRKDLVPVAATARVLVFLVTRPDFAAQDAKGFLAYAKANPGKMTFGSPGNGSSPHLATEMLKAQAGIEATHAPYRGAAPALTDLLGGQLDFLFDPGVAVPHIKAGKLKLLAVGSPKRSPLFPDVPTLAESGLPGFDADTVFGLYAPTGTPPEIIARMNREVNKILTQPGPRERILNLGGEAEVLTPEQFQQRAEVDAQRFGKIIRERGIKGD